MKRLFFCLLLIGSAWAEPRTDRMLQLAREEWEYFGRQTIGKDGNISHPGKKETDDPHWRRVGLYWRNGVYLPWTGKNTDEAWSAAFISWVMREAGLRHHFVYSDWHAHYINRAIEAREAGDDDFAFWGYRLEERAPQVGDMVAYARRDDINFDHRPEVYPSHCDIVVAVRPGEIDVIGGNVQDSVTLKTLATDESGKLIDTHQKWFCVLENRLLLQ
jgi:hypothetical protein